MTRATSGGEAGAGGRHRWAAAAAALLAIAGLACSGGRQPSYAGANLIVIALDTFRADHLGVYGRTPSPTPAIDALASESVIFERAYSTAPWTLPSFASLFTGLLPSEHGAVSGQGGPLSARHPTLAELLAAQGYHTRQFVAVDWLTSSFGLDRGFELTRVQVKGKVSTRYELYEDEVHAFLAAPPARPYLLFLHIYDAHAPYRPPPPFDGMYYEGDPRAPENDSLAVIWSERNRAMRDPKRLYRWLEGITDIDYPIGQYQAGVSYVDSKVAALIEALRASGELERSIVVLLSDHGEHLTEHDIFFTHFLPYEETLRVPLLLRLPGAARGGTRIAAEVSLVDLLTTTSELLGVEGPPRSSGVSLVPLIAGDERRLPRRWLFAEWGAYKNRVRAVWNERYRLIRFERAGRLSHELYDRRADPAETVDLSAAHPDLVEQMSLLLDARYAGLDTPGEPPPETEIDEETRRRLEALGYF